MINETEIKLFYISLKEEMNIDNLTSFAFAVLYRSYQTKKSTVALSLETKDDDLQRTMLKYVDLTPVATKVNDDFFSNEEMLRSSFEQMIKIQSKPNQDCSDLLKDTYEQNPDLFGENITETFWKFKKTGLLDIHYSLKTDKISISLTPLSLEFLQKFKDYKKNKTLHDELN